jgi:uncharacterized membrane protein
MVMKILKVGGQIVKESNISWYIIVYKLLFGLVEFLLGIGITFFRSRALEWYRIYTIQELSEDPHDLLVRLTEGVIPNILTHHSFLAIYLILLGAAKIVASIGLIYKQNWGVDLLVGLTIIMFPFQLVQLIIHPSLSDFIYIFVGLFIALYLVNFHPYQLLQRIQKNIKH